MLLENTLKINASRSKVWEVTTDVEQWPSWTPTVAHIQLVNEEPLKLGSTVRIKQPGQPETEWTVTEFVPEEYFVWESQRLGLKFRATHKIVGNGDYSINTLQLEATGIFSKLLYPLLKFAINRALAEENKGLKQKCEEL